MREMKFKFQLDPLLKFRKVQEEEAMREYSEAQDILEMALHDLEALYNTIDQAMADIEEIVRNGGLTKEKQAFLDEYIKGQKIKIERQRVVVREKKQIAEEKYEVFLEATKEYKVIEKLKENRRVVFKKEMKKKEQKVVDDLVVMRSKGSCL